MPPTPSHSIGSGPRVLLRQLREVMDGTGPAQDRLDRIVHVIARNLVAEVCSVYLTGARRDLELFATVGLNPTAVHTTRLRIGEGLVGLVAERGEAVSLANAQAHPKFAYRPETGEDPFQSFLGVPIRRGGNTLGVLVVQNQTKRQYAEEEIEALETVAMVLAEVIAAGELSELFRAFGLAPARDKPVHLSGEGLADGLAIGRVVLHQPRVQVTRLIADDLEGELVRLERALEALRTAIDDMIREPDVQLADEPRDVLETYRMFAHDRGWAERMREAIGAGLTAEAAVERVQADMRARLSRQRDPYLRERVNDLDDLSNRLLRHLIGNGKLDEIPDSAVVVALNMGPAELFDYARDRLAGVVLQEGSHLSHVAIVARALGVPLVGRVDNVVDIAESGDRILVDGEIGDVFLRPAEDVVESFRHRVDAQAERQARYRALRDKPSITRDGVEISLHINAGLLVDLPHLRDTGASGIGLFRTELQYMIHPRMPRLPVQIDFYRQIFEAAGEAPVIFRTLDLGGDKMLPYMEAAREANPAMGWRAVRIALDRPALLRLQSRAMLEAAAGRDLNVMFPMVSEVGEFEAARALVEKEIARQRRMGRPMPSRVRFGSMIEVPSLIWQIDELLPLVDFLSVGSNDLVQFLYASDRCNPRLQDRYDPLTAPVLRAIRSIVAAADRYGVPVSLCGEMAGSPLEAMALIGIGLRSLSMPPRSVGPVKAMIRGLDLGALEGLLATALEPGDPSHAKPLRDLLSDFAFTACVSV